MTIEEIQEMITKLQCELNLAVEKKNAEDKKAEEEKNKVLSQKSPAYAEMRARFSQTMMEKYNIKVFWKDIEYIIGPGHAVEQYVKRIDPNYRYKPIKSAFLHERKADDKTRVGNRKKKNINNQEEMELK